MLRTPLNGPLNALTRPDLDGTLINVRLFLAFGGPSKLSRPFICCKFILCIMQGNLPFGISYNMPQQMAEMKHCVVTLLLRSAFL